nr:MAG TPA: adenine-specific methyltransferase [Caudoviricetes sp.]
MAGNSIDAIVTDPPYGLSQTRPDKVADTITRWATGERDYTPGGKGFMGKAWDSFVPPPAVWDECMRVLKPGGHLLVFAGTRTQDLMGLSIRLAGFELRDSLTWIYGNGFPKGKSALKPAQEPILLARKPLYGTVAANMSEFGTGALNIDECRVGMSDEDRGRARVPMGEWSSSGTTGATDKRSGQCFEPAPAGRWPANVLLDPDAAAAMDEQSGVLKSGAWSGARNNPKFNGATYNGGNQYQGGKERGTTGDSGGASRFFSVFKYQAKAPKRERPVIEREDGTRVAHPTVKPLALMEWLVTLITPPGGTVLDPFAGSGTTLEAALMGGFTPVGIEAESDYIPLIEARLSRVEDTLEATL